jgi:hypothetical protein
MCGTFTFCGAVIIPFTLELPMILNRELNATMKARVVNILVIGDL